LSVLLGLPLTSNMLQGDGQAYYAMTEAVYSSGWPNLDRALYLKLVTHRVFFFDYTTGRWVSPVSFGLALVQAPFLYVGDQVLGRLRPVRDYGWVVFGHTPIPFERTLAVWLSGVVALAVFLWALDGLSRRVLTEKSMLGKGDRFLVLAGGAVAAPVLPYALLSPAMPHAWEATGAALWLLLFHRLATDAGKGGRADRWGWGALGFLSGWLVSVRVINATWVLGFVLWRLRPRQGWGTVVRRQGASWGFFAAGFLPWVLLVLIYNRVAYGHWFRTGYESGLFVWSLPLGTALKTYARLAVYYLFHPGHGLFVWSPIALLGIAGLLRQVRRHGGDHPAGGALVVWLAFWLGLATYKIWWGDSTIGPRFYVVMAPFLGYGLLGLLESLPGRAWRRLFQGGIGLLCLYSGVLYWTLSAWAARWHFLDSMQTPVPQNVRITQVLREMVRVVQADPRRVLWAVEPAPPWERMVALLGDHRAAREVRLRWAGAPAYDAHRSLLRLPLRLEGPESVLREQGFILLQIYRHRDGRPFHPQDWIAFLQLGPVPVLTGMEAVTVDFLFWGVAVHPTAGPLRLHYRWNPHYLGRHFPDRLYVCGAYQRDFQTALTLGCSSLSVVRSPFGGAFHTYRVLIESPQDGVEVEKQDPQPVVVRMEVRTLRGHRVLEPDVRVLTRPVQDLQAILGPSLAAQAGPFRGPVVLTLITDQPVHVRHRPGAGSTS